jgi:hypothetical protein
MSHSMNDTIAEPEGNEKNDRSFRIEHTRAASPLVATAQVLPRRIVDDGWPLPPLSMKPLPTNRGWPSGRRRLRRHDRRLSRGRGAPTPDIWRCAAGRPDSRTRYGLPDGGAATLAGANSLPVVPATTRVAWLAAILAHR